MELYHHWQQIDGLNPGRSKKTAGEKGGKDLTILSFLNANKVTFLDSSLQQPATMHVSLKNTMLGINSVLIKLLITLAAAAATATAPL